MKINRITQALLLGLTAQVLFSTAHAQETSSDAEDVEVIVISGQKISRTYQETKESIAVISEDFADTIGLLDIEDAYLTSANVSSISNGENFGIRGISQNSLSTGGGDGELGSFYLDGVAFTGFATRFGPRDLWDVKQVEVLRGPQSTNVGRQALIGAVVVETNDPQMNTFEGAVRGQISNFDTVSAEGMVNVAISDNSALRLSAETYSSDGYIKNENLGIDYYPTESNLIRGKYLYQANENLSALISIQYADLDKGWDNYRYDLEAIDSYIDSSNLVGQETYEGGSAVLDLNYQVNDTWSFRSITSYIDGEYFRFNDDDGGPDGGDAFRGRTAEDKNWAEELRVTYESNSLNGVFGVYYTEVDLTNNTGGFVALNPASLGVPAVLLPFYPETVNVEVLIPSETNTTNKAFFTEWDWSVSENIIVSAGFRYDEEDQTVQTSTFNSLAEGSELPDPTTSGLVAAQLGFDDVTVATIVAGITQVNTVLEGLLTPVVNEPLKTKYNAFLPQIGVSYQLDETQMISAFYKRGYRAGGVDVDTTGDISEFESEFLDNYEISYRSTHLDGDLVLNANAYYGIWTDQQVSIFEDNSFDVEIVNAGESNISGVELEVQYKVSSDTTVFTSLGFANTEFVDFCYVDDRSESEILEEGGVLCDAGNGVGQDLEGFDFAVSPDFTAALGGRHYFNDNWYAAGTITYQGSAYSDILNTSEFENDGFVLTNLNAGYVDDSLEVKVFVRNLFDEFYTNFLNEGAGASDERLVQPGVPREFGILVSYQF